MAHSHGSHGRPGDQLFSEDGRKCPSCGWQTFWARRGNFDNAFCERCGARVPSLCDRARFNEPCNVCDRKEQH